MKKTCWVYLNIVSSYMYPAICHCAINWPPKNSDRGHSSPCLRFSLYRQPWVKLNSSGTGNESCGAGGNGWCTSITGNLWKFWTGLWLCCCLCWKEHGKIVFICCFFVVNWMYIKALNMIYIYTQYTYLTPWVIWYAKDVEVSQTAYNTCVSTIDLCMCDANETYTFANSVPLELMQLDVNNWTCWKIWNMIEV